MDAPVEEFGARQSLLAPAGAPDLGSATYPGQSQDLREDRVVEDRVERGAVGAYQDWTEACRRPSAPRYIDGHSPGMYTQPMTSPVPLLSTM
jgi:hypothetical protein